jgi:hypothetical protein
MAAAAFALGVLPGRAVPARPGPAPHGLTGAYAACAGCHAAGGEAGPLPPTHRRFAAATCGTCHPGAA